MEDGNGGDADKRIACCARPGIKSDEKTYLRPGRQA